MRPIKRTMMFNATELIIIADALSVVGAEVLERTFRDLVTDLEERSSKLLIVRTST